MTTIRRTATLLGLSATVVISTGIPASATYTARSAAQPAAVATDTVVAPSDLRIAVRCDASTLYADVSWTRSTSPRVTGYAIDATINGGPMSFRAPASASTYTYTTGRVWAAYPMPVSVTVTTETDYRWTRSSAPLNTTVTTC